MVLPSILLLSVPLQSGVYVDPEAPPHEVVHDLEAQAERAAQMQAQAADLRGFQAALGLAQEEFGEVGDALRAAHARCARWANPGWARAWLGHLA